VYIMNKQGAEQSIVFAAQFAPLKNSPDDISFDALNTILGGSFTSRINMNIREDKHWSYGARTAVPNARAQRPYFAYTSVQQDKTKETMIEIKKELTDITDKRRATEDELKKIQNSLTLQLPGRWETMNAVVGSIVDIVNYGLADDYYNTYPLKIKALQLESITDVAKRTLKPETLLWVIVGDRKKIEAGIRELNFGEVKILDVDGNMIQ
jgi:zinc protease